MPRWALAQLVHESLDQLGTAVAEQLGTHPQLAVRSRWARSQLTLRDHDRQGLDAGFGQ
jgi:hypothetical protein